MREPGCRAIYPLSLAMKPPRCSTIMCVAILSSAAALAQYSRGVWTTFGGDPQPTGWNNLETEITPETAPKLKLEWSIKLDNAPMALHGLTAPLTRSQIYTATGVRDLADRCRFLEPALRH